jgi:hypothetical protein
MCDQMILFLEESHLLCKRQFGFRRYHSTEQMLLSLLQVWKEFLDSPGPTFVAAFSLDVRKAFDTVNHDLLVKKLALYNFEPQAVSLLRSYLSGRLQAVKIESNVSDLRTTLSGVPQGSILGPLLFNISVNDLLISFPQAFAYADDTVIYTTGTRLHDTLQDAKISLDAVNDWYRCNGYSLNLGKTQLCVFTNSDVANNLSVDCQGCLINNSKSLKLLGVTIDQRLTFYDQALSMISKSNRALFILSKLRSFLNLNQFVKAYKVYVRPLLEYCSSLFLGCSEKINDFIEKAQNRVVRVVFHAPRVFSVSRARFSVGIQSLRYRRLSKFSSFIEHNVLKGKSSQYLCEVLKSQHCSREHRNRTCFVLKPFCRTRFGKTSFKNLLYEILNRTYNF